ncbi:MAG: PP2C family protein-serine/threonine phosphatase [Phycisphaerales bacterium]
MALRIASTPHQGPCVLVSCTSDSPSPLAQSIIQRVERHLSPRGLGLDYAPLTSLLSSTPQRKGSQAPVLVIADEEASDSALNRILDTLSTNLCPALVLLPASHSHARMMFLSAGIMCETLDIDPAQAAVILWTLAQRQPAIQHLANELRLTELSINSVNSEMLKLHEELASAASIQREYMPKALPEIDGIDMGIVYRPASYVSGDIYDIVELDEHHTGFFLADAVGHGVPAALMTMVISQGLHKTEGKGDALRIVEPAEALRRLNQTMTKNAGEQARFATAAYAIHDKRSNTITVAGAGHPPSLLVRAGSGEVEQVESEGPLLGVFADLEFKQTTHQLNPGDVFIIYSDGFEVAFPKQDAEGDERKRPTLTYLKELATAGSGEHALNEAIATLEEHLDAQCGSLHQPDDITALFMSSAGALEAWGV